MNLPPPGPLRILHVVDSLEFGGLERVVTDLALAQKAHGETVQVFSITATTGFADELRQAGVPVLLGHKQGPLDRRVIQALKTACREANVVHAHNFVPSYYAAAALTLSWRRPAFVGTCHDMGARLSNRKLRWLFGWALSRMDRVAMVGGQVHERYIESGLVSADKAATVLNGIPVERFTPTSERRAEARRRLGLKADDLVIGCVGRLVGLKNHALLLSTVPALVRDHPRLRVVIVGYGELEGALRQQVLELGIQDHVLLTGKRSDVADLLPAFDVFALPSKTEGLSIALLEACASALAIVASHVGGNPEIIQNEQTGLLVPVNDAAALQEALATLLNDSALRARLGAAAANWVAGNASTRALRQAYEQFYRAALTAPH